MKNMYDGHHVEHINSSELEETDGNITEEDILEVGNTVGHIVDTFDTFSELVEFDINLESRQKVGSFHAYTPRKTYPCKQCECVDCFVMHMLGRHRIARAPFL